MIQVRIGKLPNGKVPVAEVRDGTTRSVLMRMVENQVSTGERTKTLERAVVELQGRPAGSGPRGEDAEYWANKAKESEDQAKVYAHGANASKDLAETAKDAAVAAKDGAESAKADAETAKSGAESAKGDAESARNEAQSYASNASSYKDLANVAKENAIYNAQQANNARVRAEAAAAAAAAFARWAPLAHNQEFANNTATSAAFLPMSLFVWDNKKTYDAEVRFVYWYRHDPKITSTVRHFLVGEYTIDETTGVPTEVKFVRSSIKPSASKPIVTGRVETLTLENVSPASYLAFINGSTKSITDKSHQAAGQAYWDIYIYIKEHSAS